MEFALLGPLEVRREGRAIAVGGSKARALLAMLVLHANEPVSAERLAGAVWGDDAPASATRTVQVYVSRLRKTLGEETLLVTTPAGYRLDVQPGELDVDRFERLVEEGGCALTDGRAGDAGARLREALRLWRGPALGDLAFASFAQAEIARLEEQRLAALELRVEADLAAGRHARLVGELQQLLAEYPLREGLHGQLMLALYRSGRQAEALEVYQAARRELVEQLGIEPGTELRELHQRILAQDPVLTLADPSGERVRAPRDNRERGARPTSVPAPPTATVGRAEELDQLRGMIGDPAARLVTVVGPPGVGKTRVAVELARAIAPELRDGAAFVSLAAVDACEHVASTIARELGITVFPGDTVQDALARHLSRQQLLLVLDNLEHLLNAAPLVADLVARAADVTVLATSREPLRLRVERLFRLEPLALPQASCDDSDSTARDAPALALFEAVARARDPDFALSDGDLPAAVAVCRRLDGLPLAIELAAGNLGLLSIVELAERLRLGIDALGRGPRDAPARQHTLAATLEWSHRLLADAEQDALAALAVFAGGCGRDAAEAVTGAPLDVMEALVAKNLVLSDRGADGTVRLRMLETVREFAAARLELRGDADAVRRRHCEHYLALAERVRPELLRSRPASLYAQLDREVHNLRAALAWSHAHPAPVLALRLASAVSFYFVTRALEREATAWLEAAFNVAGDVAPPALRAAALEAYAYAVTTTETIERAESAARESLEIRASLDDRAGCAASMVALAYVHQWAHRIDEGYGTACEAERLARESGNEQAQIDALHSMAQMAPTVEQALAIGEQAAAAHRATGSQSRLAWLQTSLAYHALSHGDATVARRLGAEAVDVAEKVAEPLALMYAHGNAGLAELFDDDPTSARQAFVRQLRLMVRHHYFKIVYEPLIGLAAVAGSEGDDRFAATLHGAADAVTHERPHPDVARQLEARCFASARVRLGEQAWEAAYNEGAEWDREQAVDAALDRVAPIANR
jgi:predicted ATPase/DNA-binding SARP family transcriptional activator